MWMGRSPKSIDICVHSAKSTIRIPFVCSYHSFSGSRGGVLYEGIVNA